MSEERNTHMKSVILAAALTVSTLLGLAGAANANDIASVVQARIAANQGTATPEQLDLVRRYGG
jgi:hypothetical protein